jgi:hypothetical protein
MAILHHLDELLVDACVLRQFGVEGRSHDFALAHQHWITTSSGQNFNSFSSPDNLRCANKDHLEWLVAQFGLRFMDRTVNLSSVGVPTDTYVHYVKGFLRRVLNMLGQQDSTGACPERRLGRNEVAQLFQKSALGQKIQKGAGLATGNHNAVNSIKLLRLADQSDVGAQLLQTLLVRFLITLDAKDPDFHCFFYIPSDASIATILLALKRKDKLQR